MTDSTPHTMIISVGISILVAKLIIKSPINAINEPGVLFIKQPSRPIPINANPAISIYIFIRFKQINDFYLLVRLSTLIVHAIDGIEHLNSSIHGPVCSFGSIQRIFHGYIRRALRLSLYLRRLLARQHLPRRACRPLFSFILHKFKKKLVFQNLGIAVAVRQAFTISPDKSWHNGQ